MPANPVDKNQRKHASLTQGSVALCRGGETDILSYLPSKKANKKHLILKIGITVILFYAGVCYAKTSVSPLCDKPEYKIKILSATKLQLQALTQDLSTQLGTKFPLIALDQLCNQETEHYRQVQKEHEQLNQKYQIVLAELNRWERDSSLYYTDLQAKEEKRATLRKEYETIQVLTQTSATALKTAEIALDRCIGGYIEDRRTFYHTQIGRCARDPRWLRMALSVLLCGEPTKPFERQIHLQLKKLKSPPLLCTGTIKKIANCIDPETKPVECFGDELAFFTTHPLLYFADKGYYSLAEQIKLYQSEEYPTSLETRLPTLEPLLQKYQKIFVNNDGTYFGKYFGVPVILQKILSNH